MKKSKKKKKTGEDEENSYLPLRVFLDYAKNARSDVFAISFS